MNAQNVNFRLISADISLKLTFWPMTKERHEDEKALGRSAFEKSEELGTDIAYNNVCSPRRVRKDRFMKELGYSAAAAQGGAGEPAGDFSGACQKGAPGRADFLRKGGLR